MSTKIASKISFPIFIVCGKSPITSYGGGYSSFALNLAKILKRLGFEVYILAIGEKKLVEKTDCGTVIILSFSFFNLKFTALPGLPFYSYFFSKEIIRIINNNNISGCIVWGIGPWGLAGKFLKDELKDKVIFVNNYFTTIEHEWNKGLQAVRIYDYGILLKIKFFIIYHTIVKILSIFEKEIITSVDCIITNYKSTETILKSQFNINEKKIIRSSFYIEPYARNVKHIGDSDVNSLPPKYILFLSRHDPRKGVNFLLRAIKLLSLKKIEIPVVIAGAGEMLEANKKLAKKLKLKNVLFLGFVNDARPLIVKSTIFCLPTLEEGAGALIINEAMYLGATIVTTACDGIVEDVIHMKTGVLVPPGDEVALAEALEKTLNDDSLRKYLSQNAKTMYLKRFSLKKMTDDTKKIIEELVNNSLIA